MDREEVRNAMQQYFEKPEIMLKIQDYLSRKGLTYQEIDNDTLINILDELQLLDSILAQINSSDSPPESSISLSKKVLKFTIQSARAFAEMSKYVGSKFFISLGFLHQRFQTHLIKCVVEPKIFQSFEMTISKQNLSVEELKNIELSIVIAKQKRIVYSVKEIDWRFVLAFGYITFDIQLASYSDPNISVGILSLKLELIPKAKGGIISQRMLNNQFQLQKKIKEKVNNQFFEYSKQFWNDYKSIHPTFAKRSIPLYRESEDRVFVHVCKFVCPLFNIRGIDSPFHALRFVSLIKYQQQTINSKSLNKRFHTLLSSGQGNVIDHCHLLCSLLLGFGLSAYVCTGYSAKGEHSWVMTFNKKQTIVWQSLNGLRFSLDTQKGSFYKIVNTIYNHEQFYANIQTNQMIGATTFDLKTQSKWKQIPTQKIQKLLPFNHQISLLYPTINVYSLQQQLQTQLIQQIINYRKQYKLDTRIDLKLSSILSIALSNYQYQRITQQTFGEKQFQEAIRGYIPEKHTFKAFPIQLQQTNAEKIINILKANKMSNQVLLSRGDSVHLALKTKIVVYPDNYLVVWLSLASRYYKLL